MPLFNGDVIFVDTSGQVRTQTGDLTLRANDTGTASIIVGSGVSLRPDRDIRMDLGRPDNRWHRVHTGNIIATSGTITGFNATTVFASSSISTNGSIDAGGAISGDSLASTNDTTVGGILYALSDIDVARHVTITGDLTVYGATTLGSVATGTIYPVADVTYTVGLPSLRYSHIYAASGVFNALSPQTSGSFLNVHGSLFPGKTALYSLGSSSLRWGNIFATSGNITTIDTTTVNATDLNSTGAINAFGSLGVLGLAALNGGTFFGNAAAPSTDATTEFGLSALRWRDIYVVSGHIETINPRVSGTSIFVNGSIFPDQPAVRALGNLNNRWSHVYASSGSFGALAGAGGNISVYTGLVPDGGSWKLGLGAQPWSEVNATTGNITTVQTSAINIDGDITFSNPNHTISMENGSFDLNASSFGFTNGNVNFQTNGILVNRPTITFPNGTVGNISTDQDAAEVVNTVITIGASGAAGGLIINRNSEVDIYNYTIPANTLGPSGTLRLIINGNITNMTASAVTYTPRVYVGGSVIWGDALSVANGPRARCFELIADIQGLGNRQAQRVCGSIFMGTAAAASVAGNGDWQSSNSATFSWGRWASAAASGTVDFSQPVNLRVSMQLGTSNSNASYSGVKGTLVHYPYAIV